MKQKLLVGVITTLSGRWPQKLPQERRQVYGKWLRETFSEVSFVEADELGGDPKTVERIAQNFKARGIDLIIMVYGAFTGDDACTILAEITGVPLVLWAPKEPPFEKDTRMFANALVSLTMNMASLKRLEYTAYAIYGDKEDDNVARKISRIIKTCEVVKKLKGTLLGLFGYRPTAFYNSAFDEGLIRKIFGIQMEETDLKTVFDKMATVSDELYAKDMKFMNENYKTDCLPEGHLANHVRLHLALKEIFKEQSYDFGVIKCWPEMGNSHTQPCAVLGRLADEGINIGCEGDVDAEITQIVQNYITGLPTFISDMINVDEKKNIMTFWHCGNAAPSLKNNAYEFSINNHPLVGQGTAFYGSLKTGKVTIARFCNIHGMYKLFLLRGTSVNMDRYTKGVMVNVKVERPVKQILKMIWENGIAHHYSVVWDDVAEQMIEICKFLHVEIIEA